MMKSMIVIFLVGTLFTGGLHALQCYQCGLGGVNCATPHSEWTTCNTTGLLGQCISIRTAGILVSQGCSEACLAVNALGSGTWCCNSELCNSAPTSATFNIFIMSTAAILAVLGAGRL